MVAASHPYAVKQMSTTAIYLIFHAKPTTRVVTGPATLPSGAGLLLAAFHAPVHPGVPKTLMMAKSLVRANYKGTGT